MRKWETLNRPQVPWRSLPSHLWRLIHQPRTERPPPWIILTSPTTLGRSGRDSLLRRFFCRRTWEPEVCQGRPEWQWHRAGDTLLSSFWIRLSDCEVVFWECNWGGPVESGVGKHPLPVLLFCLWRVFCGAIDGGCFSLVGTVVVTPSDFWFACSLPGGLESGAPLTEVCSALTSYRAGRADLPRIRLRDRRRCGPRPTPGGWEPGWTADRGLTASPRTAFISNELQKVTEESKARNRSFKGSIGESQIG